MSASSSMRLSASSGLFACTVVSEPSCPVVMAWSMSSASPPRTSPTTRRSGRIRSALRTSSRMPTSPLPSRLAPRASRRATCGRSIRSSAASSTVTIRSAASIRAASAPSSDVLPLDVPPLMTIERRARTQPSSRSASAVESEPSSTSSASVNGRGANRRSVSSGPSGASGGSTTFSREPSASRASTIGCASSRRRPARAARRTQASRSALGVVEAQRRPLQTAAPLDPHLGGPVHDHLGDARVVEQRRERIGPSLRLRRTPAPRALPRHRAARAPRGSCDGRRCERGEPRERAARRREPPLPGARHARVVLHGREQRQPHLLRHRLRGARVARTRHHDAEAAAARVRVARAAAPCAAPRARRGRRRSRRSR